MTGSRTAGAGATVVAILTLAACTSSGSDAGSSTPPVSTPAPVSSDTPTPTGTPPTRTPSASPTGSAPTSSTPASSAPTNAPPSATVPAFVTTCPRLTVRVIPGGAIRGAEIAALQYVNDGTTTCTITGVPSAVLLRGGVVIGNPARPDGTAVRPFTLQPGGVGESLLRDFSTCDAPLSDSIRVSTPGRGSPVVRPARLRACELQLAPVGAPA